MVHSRAAGHDYIPKLESSFQIFPLVCSSLTTVERKAIQTTNSRQQSITSNSADQGAVHCAVNKCTIIKKIRAAIRLGKLNG